MPAPESAAIVVQENKLQVEAPESDISELVSETNGWIDKARAARQNWINQLDKNFKWRRGMIDKPRPDVPFRGSSNLKFRRAEREIRKLAPQFEDAVHSPTHLVRFIPCNKDSVGSAAKLENYYDYFYRHVMEDFQRTVTEAADCFLENGKVVCKTTMKYVVEPKTISVSGAEYTKDMLPILQALSAKMGKPVEKFTEADYLKVIMLKQEWDEDNPEFKERARDIIKQFKDEEDFIAIIVDKEKYNDPYIGCCRELSDIIVPPDAPDIQESPWVVHEFLLTEQQMISEAEENGGKLTGVYELLEFLKDRLYKTKPGTAIDPESRSLMSAIQKAEGISPEGEIMGKIALREVHRWIPRKLIKRMKGRYQGKSNVMVRAVLTYAYDIPPDNMPPLRVIEEPYEHCRWPFRDATLFSGRRRYYSGEGIVQSIEPFERKENISLNAALDRTTIALNPPTFYYEGLGITPNTHRQIGQWHPTKIPPGGGIETLSYPEMASAAKLDAEQMKGIAEDFVGSSDLRSQLNYTNAPTAQQVQETSAPSIAIRNKMIRTWLDFWTGNYRDVFELHQQHMFATGRKEVSFPNANSPGEIYSLTPDDLKGKFLILAGADLTRLNPVLQGQNEYAAAQFIMNPALAWAVDEYNFIADFIAGRIGATKAQVWLKDKATAEQSKQQFQQVQAQVAVNKAQSKSGRTGKIKEMPGSPGAGMQPK